jgi:hypothetical protein
MPSLTTEQKAELRISISTELSTAERHAKTNQVYDIVFKVIILVLSIAIVVTSSLSAANLYSTILSVCSAILGGIMAALSAFASSQINFSQRQATYTAKVSALKSLDNELIFDPDRDTILARLCTFYGV